MKRTIFLVINSLNGGGAERVAARLSEYWNKKYNLHVISIAKFTDEDYEFHGKKVSLNYNGKDKHAIKELEQICYKYQPDVMISFLQKASFYTLAVRYQCKKIVSVRNYLKEKYKGIKLKIWETIIKLLYPKSDYVVSVSKEINECMKNDYKIPEKKCVCIYNPYDIETIQALAKENLDETEKDVFKDNYVICNVGHVSEQKGQIHLIRILPHLVQQIPNIKLVIVGKDNSNFAESLKQLALELNVSDNVVFTGIKQNPYKIMSNSNLFVFPSLFEGFPNALVEAMTCKTPVIASDCKTGPKEILEPRITRTSR